MLRIRSYLTVLMATCLLLVGGPMLGTAPEGKALTPDELLRHVDEGLDCVLQNKLSCQHVETTKKWAEDVTEWKYPNGNKTDGTKANAFKHCIWIGATATRLGETDAYRVGFTHEKYAKDQKSDFRIMDEWNNFIGAGIGAKAKADNLSDQWGYVIDECQKLAESHDLYGPNGVKGAY